jgi:glycosyltransferase involved in cell wall biosynthesis
MKNPLVSFIIATRNRADLLPFSIESAIRQTYENIEIIIIDDYSTDKTISVIEALKQKDKRIRSYRTESNVGPGKARNIGIYHAFGQYIAILDDDDISFPDRICEQVKILEERSQIGLVFCSLAWVDKEGNPYQYFPETAYDNCYLDPDLVFRQLYLEEKKIPHVTIMFRKEIFMEIGGYPESIWIGEDRFMLMKWAAKGIKMYYIPKTLVFALGDDDHTHIMAQSSLVLESKLKIIHMIKAWLLSQNITRFNKLHHFALSNQFVREARAKSGFKGLILCGKALWYNSNNRYAWGTIFYLLKKAIQKLY